MRAPPLERSWSAPVGKTQTKQSKPKKLEVVPNSEQIFRGLTFFYIRNSDVHQGRKIRISKAKARGARWVRDCGPDVTHIIVDEKLDISEALKDLPARRIPLNIPIIRSTWQEDCIQAKSIVDLYRSGFRIVGMSSPFDLVEEAKDAREQINVEDADELKA